MMQGKMDVTSKEGMCPEEEVRRTITTPSSGSTFVSVLADISTLLFRTIDTIGTIDTIDTTDKLRPECHHK